jgi:hypothetical protein
MKERKSLFRVKRIAPEWRKEYNHNYLMEVTTNVVTGAASSKPSFKSLRAGQWIRFAAVAICLIALICYFVLPQIQIDYQRYDNNSVSDKVLAFPSEVLSAATSFFGAGYFSYYKSSDLSDIDVLVSQKANFNFFCLACVLIALIACAMDVWLNLTKKNEKWSKLVTLLFVICGLMAFMGPIFFLASNGFGAGDFTKTGDYGHYWNYFELYVHDAPGAIVTGILFFVSGITFSVGTGLEGGDKNDNRLQED